MVQPQIIVNGDMEDSKSDTHDDVDPWTSTAPYGFHAYWGTNFVGRAGNLNLSPESGKAYLWFVSTDGVPPIEVSQPITGIQQGQVYNLTYYAYGWLLAPNDPDALSNWTVSVGSNAYTDGAPTVYQKNQDVPADQWPFFWHSFNATGEENIISYVNLNNSAMYLDNVQLTCVTCPPVKKPDHTGAIVGGVIGGLAGVALLVVGAFWLWLWVLKPRRQQRASGKAFEADREKNGSHIGSPDQFATHSPAPPYVPQRDSNTYSGRPEVQEADIHRPDMYPVFRPNQGGTGSHTHGTSS